MNILKTFFSSLFIAVSTYSIFPTPRTEWRKETTQYLLVMLPFVGLLIGVCSYTLAELALIGEFPLFLAAALCGIAPQLLSGFFHMDGYMDSADAVFSQRDLAQRQRILKDSHIGSFAAVALGVYFLFSVAAMHAVLEYGSSSALYLLILIPVAARALAAINMLTRPLMSQTGYGALYREGKTLPKIVWLSVVLIGCIVVGYLVSGLTGLTTLFVGLVVAQASCIGLTQSLGGINGDVTGCTLVIFEMSALVGLALL